jgi:hypothetical protein
MALSRYRSNDAKRDSLKRLRPRLARCADRAVRSKRKRCSFSTFSGAGVAAIVGVTGSSDTCRFQGVMMCRNSDGSSGYRRGEALLVSSYRRRAPRPSPESMIERGRSLVAEKPRNLR